MYFTILIIFIGILNGVSTQENAQSKLSNALLECYNTTEILLRDNKLPHNMHAFIAILQKIEDNPELQMDLPQLSVAILHRFRQCGISESPSMMISPEIIPYAPQEFQFFSHARTLKMNPGEVRHFPNDSISLIERCTLHSMISNSIDTKERGDESVTCQSQYNQYRVPRNLKDDNITVIKHINSDVETLTPEELEVIKNKHNQSNIDSNFGPNWFYPPLPPNHPEIAQIQTLAHSKCPLENGVIATKWGTVSGGPLIAGIVAGLHPQNVRISNLLLRKDWQPLESLSAMTLDNKWLATLAGDLAEVAIRQGPQKDHYKVGNEGHWNSTIIPKSYFIDEYQEQNAEFTAPEIRGDVDGFILASEVNAWYRDVPALKLSQIFDMYYSDRGVFNTSIRACNRRALLTSIAPNNTTSAQASSASVVLFENLSKYYVAPEKLKQFAVQAANNFFAFVPTMKNEMTCRYSNSEQLFNRIATDITIVIDTQWEFSAIQSILTLLLENIEINKYNSNFTLINGHNGLIMINSSNSILNFYNFNETQYSFHVKGFDLALVFEKLESIQLQKLNRERELHFGGSSSHILLFIPFVTSTSMSENEKTLCTESITRMRQNVPDMIILFLVLGSKNNWAIFTQDSSNDIITIGYQTIGELRGPMINLVNRIKKVPRRLINSQCGGDFNAKGNSAEYTEYLEPSGINFYRLHPNYFYTPDGDISTVKIQTINGGVLRVCESRNPIHFNTTDKSITCTKVDRTHKISFSCVDASDIYQCNPLYLSIAMNSIDKITQRCTDSKYCRYPDAFQYKISYENLKCTNDAGSITTSSIVSLVFIIYIFTLDILLF